VGVKHGHRLWSMPECRIGTAYASLSSGDGRQRPQACRRSIRRKRGLPDRAPRLTIREAGCGGWRTEKKPRTLPRKVSDLWRRRCTRRACTRVGKTGRNTLEIDQAPAGEATPALSRQDRATCARGGAGQAQGAQPAPDSESTPKGMDLIKRATRAPIGTAAMVRSG